jgi:hypothetical protein
MRPKLLQHLWHKALRLLQKCQQEMLNIKLLVLVL